jgi:hypothetical protein
VVYALADSLLRGGEHSCHCAVHTREAAHHVHSVMATAYVGWCSLLQPAGGPAHLRAGGGGPQGACVRGAGVSMLIAILHCQADRRPTIDPDLPVKGPKSCLTACRTADVPALGRSTLETMWFWTRTTLWCPSRGLRRCCSPRAGTLRRGATRWRAPRRASRLWRCRCAGASRSGAAAPLLMTSAHECGALFALLAGM